ncbi:MAG: hypothetical protein HFF02_05055 [Erysipelotrichaceae bacterium]|nr:hypothetical protein [Erysipelotrichaceae bacterium]
MKYCKTSELVYSIYGTKQDTDMYDSNRMQLLRYTKALKRIFQVEDSKGIAKVNEASYIKLMKAVLDDDIIKKELNRISKIKDYNINELFENDTSEYLFQFLIHNIEEINNKDFMTYFENAQKIFNVKEEIVNNVKKRLDDIDRYFAQDVRLALYELYRDKLNHFFSDMDPAFNSKLDRETDEYFRRDAEITRYFKVCDEDELRERMIDYLEGHELHKNNNGNENIWITKTLQGDEIKLAREYYRKINAGEMKPWEMDGDYIGTLHALSFIFSDMIPNEDELDVDENGKIVLANKV